MKHPRTVMTFSDSGAHVSQIMDARSRPTCCLLGPRRQAFTLEEAVRMITLAPATAWGFADRGLLREGFVADLNVFDPDTRRRPRCPRSSTTCPPAPPRLVQRATGFLATVVGGEVVLDDGEHTGALPGALVRRGV